MTGKLKLQDQPSPLSWPAWLACAILLPSAAYSAVQVEISAESLRLSGRVPSMAQREALHLQLRDASPKPVFDHLIVDRRETGQGLSALAGILEPIAKILHAGTLRLDGDRLTISGSVSSTHDRDEAIRRIEPVRDSGLSLEIALTIQTPAPEPWIECAFSTVGCTLTGLVRLAETSECLQTAFPGSVCLEISSAALSSLWEAGLTTVLPSLLASLAPEIPDGTIRLTPGCVTVRGAVPGVEKKLRATRLIKSALGRTIRVENYLAVKPVQTAQP